MCKKLRIQNKLIVQASFSTLHKLPIKAAAINYKVRLFKKQASVEMKKQ